MRTIGIDSKVDLGDMALWTLQGFLAGIFLTAGIVQILGLPAEVLLFDQIGLGQWLRLATGALQIAGAIALVSRFAGLGGLVLAVLMTGAAIAAFISLPIDPVPLVALAGLSLMVALARLRPSTAASDRPALGVARAVSA